MKKKPSKLTLVIAIIMGIYFCYRRTDLIALIPDSIGILGLVETVCGVVLIGLSIFWFFKKPKKEDE